MEAITRKVKTTIRGKNTVVDSCYKCHRYAEHFGYQVRTTKCKFCDFQFEEEGHLVYLEAYGKIMFARFMDAPNKLISHAFSKHPEKLKGLGVRIK